MAMESIVDNLDNIDESLHEHYKKDEKTGKFYLELVNPDAHPRIVQLKNSEFNTRKKLTEANTALTVYKTLGEVDEVQAQLQRIPELEAAASGKVDDTKINEIVEARVKVRVTPLERERDTLKTQLTTAQTEIEGFKRIDFTRTIADTVRTAATELSMLPTAVEDATLLAERHFKRDEATGEIINNDGLTIKTWLMDLQPKRPHWWPTSEGAGAQGGRSGGKVSSNPFTHENWNLTEQGKIYSADPGQAEKLAKLAGTTVGGSRPKPKK